MDNQHLMSHISVIHYWSVILLHANRLITNKVKFKSKMIQRFIKIKRVSCCISRVLHIVKWWNIRDKTAPSHFPHTYITQTQPRTCPLISSHLLVSADGRTVAQMAICLYTHSHSHTQLLFSSRSSIIQKVSKNIISRECEENWPEMNSSSSLKLCVNTNLSRSRWSRKY